MNLRNLAGAVLLCLFPASAAFAGPAACLSREALADAIASRLPQAKLMTLEGGEARLFLAELNRLPPATALKADMILVVEPDADAGATLVILFERGCARSTGSLPRGAARQLMAVSARNGA